MGSNILRVTGVLKLTQPGEAHLFTLDWQVFWSLLTTFAELQLEASCGFMVQHQHPQCERRFHQKCFYDAMMSQTVASHSFLLSHLRFFQCWPNKSCPQLHFLLVPNLPWMFSVSEERMMLKELVTSAAALFI